MVSPDNITLNQTIVSNNADGEPVSVTTSIDVNCYVDFSNNMLKITHNGESILVRGKIFITINSEIEKVIFTPNEIVFNGKSYNVLNFEHGLKHIEITI